MSSAYFIILAVKKSLRHIIYSFFSNLKFLLLFRARALVVPVDIRTTHLVELFEYSIDALFRIFIVFVRRLLFARAKHLIYGVHYVVHFFPRDVAVVVYVVQLECP